MTEVATPPSNSQVQVRAERFQSSLQSRVIRSAGIQKTQSFRAVLLERGLAELTSDTTEQELVAPLVAWLPWSESMRLKLAAGSQGVHLLLEPQSLVQALRSNLNDTTLAFMAERTTILNLSDDSDAAQAAVACFQSILSETSRPLGMSDAVINSQLGLLLIYLFRGQSAGSYADSQVMQRPLAGRFVTLVETHFRDHWKLQSYSHALGISRDRLNDVCLRAHGRTPGALIRSRVMLEARRLLENTSLSVDQIAGGLGYASAPQFNRFFKSQQGVPPGRYRAGLRQAEALGQPSPAAPYEWP